MLIFHSILISVTSNLQRVGQEYGYCSIDGQNCGVCYIARLPLLIIIFYFTRNKIDK